MCVSFESRGENFRQLREHPRGEPVEESEKKSAAQLSVV